MESIEKKERVKTLILTSEIIGKLMSVEAAIGFAEITADIPANKFALGIDKARRTCQWMPSPAEFRILACGMPLMPRAAEINAEWRKRWGDKPV